MECQQSKLKIWMAPICTNHLLEGMIGLEGHPVTNQINTCNLLVFLTILNEGSFIYYT